MKNWTKRSIVILSLGVLGTVALAMRPAFSEDEAMDLSMRSECTQKLRAGTTPAALDVHYALDLSRPQGISCYLHQEGEGAFPLLQPATWNLRIRTGEGKLEASCDTPVLHATDPLCQVQTEYATHTNYEGREKMPDNTYHRIYSVTAICRVTLTRPFWQGTLHSVLIQHFKVDVQDGIVEPRAPYIPPMLEAQYQEPVYVSRMPVQGLPQRNSGSAAQTALTQMLYCLGCIDSPELAGLAAEALPAMAKETLPLLPAPDQAWPACWGDDADMAQDYARRVVDTLLYLQEKECFGNKALADFINSPDFARYFGESFADKVRDPLDEPLGDFTIEKVSTEDWGDEDEEEAPALDTEEDIAEDPAEDTAAE